MKKIIIFLLFIPILSFADNPIPTRLDAIGVPWIDDTATVQAGIEAGTLTKGTYTVGGNLTADHSCNFNGSTINCTLTSGNLFNYTVSNIKLSWCTVIGPGSSTGTSRCINIGTFDHDTVDHFVISAFQAQGILTGNGNYPVLTNNNISNIGTQALYCSSTVTINGGVIANDTLDQSMFTTSYANSAMLVRGSSGTALASHWTVHDIIIKMPSNPTYNTAECYEHRNAPYSNLYNITCTGGSIGISVVGSDHVTVKTSTTTGQNSEGIEYANSGYGYQGNNTIKNQLLDGILMDSPLSVTDTIDNTSIDSCARYCLHTYNSANGIRVTNSTFNSRHAFPSVYIQSANNVVLSNTNLLGNSLGNYAVQFDTSTGSFSMTNGNATNFTSKLCYFYGAVTISNVNFRCVTTTGTVVGYNTGGGITIGSNINLSLPCYTGGPPVIFRSGVIK